MREIAAVPDDRLRRLYTAGRGPSPDAAIGTFVHVAWWRELALAADAGDQAYISEFLQGLPIVGRVAKSQIWAPRDDPLLSSPEDLAARAWEVREVVHSSLRRQRLHAHSQKLWDAMADVSSGAAIGPFSSFPEVDAATGSKRWVPTARFPVVQKNKMRGVDAARMSTVNAATAITEKLALTSVDHAAATIRQLDRLSNHAPLAGWVLVESNAYRQIGVRPDHRPFAVIAMLDPARGISPISS